MACPGHAVSGRVIPKTLRTTNLQSITTKCKQRLSLGRSLGRPCPRRHALGNQFRLAQNCRGSQSSETLGSSGLFGVWNPHQSTPLSMSTQQASLNVLTAKLRSVRLWRSRFNLVSRCLRTFHTFWSRFPTLEGDISQRWHTWGPISLLESAHPALISFWKQNYIFLQTCLLAMLLFIFLSKCSCSNLMGTGSLQGPRNAFNWFVLWGPKDLWKTMPTQLLPHVYAEWKGCLRGSFPRLGAYAGASTEFFVGQSCTW